MIHTIHFITSTITISLQLRRFPDGAASIILHKMDDIQQEYRDRMTSILSLNTTPKLKSLLL